MKVGTEGNDQITKTNHNLRVIIFVDELSSIHRENTVRIIGRIVASKDIELRHRFILHCSLSFI